MLAMEALQHLERALRFAGSRRDKLELAVAVWAPGTLGGSPRVGVTSLEVGFDWDAGYVLVRTERELCALGADERDAIVQSVRQGQSWHAYQAQKKLRARIAELEAEVAALRAFNARQ